MNIQKQQLIKQLQFTILFLRNQSIYKFELNNYIECYMTPKPNIVFLKWNHTVYGITWKITQSKKVYY